MTVSPLIRVEVEDAESGEDLLEALTVRGLSSRLVRADEGVTELEVAAGPDRSGLWNLEVVTALEAWLEQTDRASVVARLDRTAFTVRAPRPLVRDEPPATDDPDATLNFDPVDPNRTAALPAVALPDDGGAARSRGTVVAAGAGAVVLGLLLLWVLAAIAVQLL